MPALYSGAAAVSYRSRRRANELFYGICQAGHLSRRFLWEEAICQVSGPWVWGESNYRPCRQVVLKLPLDQIAAIERLAGEDSLEHIEVYAKAWLRDHLKGT